MGWLAEWGVAAAAVLWLFGPGLLFGVVSGLRGLALWAFAPAASAALLAVSALAFGVWHIRWSPWTAAGAVIVLALVAWGMRAALRLAPEGRAADHGFPGWWVIPAGVAIGATLVTLRLTLYIGGPQNPSQTNDGVFHLNALQHILDTGSASSLDITGMLGISSFYPGAWHAPTSLVAMMTGADVVVAANITSIVIGALVWTSGVAWFTLIATRGDRLASGAAAALSAAVAAFPLLLIQWGVLYPSLLAVALLPGVLALVVRLAGVMTRTPRREREITWQVVLIAVGLSAIALAQPAMLLIWAIVAGTFGVWGVIALWPSARARVRVLMVAGVLVGAAIVAIVWRVFGWLTTSIWPPSAGRAQAVLDVVGNGYAGSPPAWGVSILMVVGLVLALRVRHLRWLFTSWAALAVLYFLVTAMGNPLARGLVAPFYADPYRIAAVLPLVVVPLAGIGLSGIVRWAQGRLVRGTPATGVDARAGSVASGWALGALATLGVVSIAVAPVISWRDVWTDAVERVTWYDITDSTYLSSDERDLLLRLPGLVPDELIVGNPSTGMAFGYALADQSVYPLSWQPPQTAAYAVLADRLNRAASDPDVCTALATIGARYVLDFGAGDANYGRYVLPGFTDFTASEGFELVDSVGQATLWRVAACDG